MLSGRLFKLLFIHPTQHQDQYLQCSCLPFELDAAPPYEALSYAWGPPEPAVELQCNGLGFTVRPELANALAHMRLQNCTRIVWTDAICINQDDVEERNHQVPLMGSIFTSAKRVLVWLGLADPISDHIQETFDVLELISSTCRESLDDPGHETRDRWERVQIAASVFTPTVRSGLSKLFKRPWFSRIWCLQEIRLATNALVLCGEHEIDWQDFGTTVSWFFDQLIQYGVGKSYNDAVGEWICSSIDTTAAEETCDPVLRNFLDTLQFSRKFDSTDPKDKVYAILNLVSPRPELDGFEVRYDKSVGEVFANTAVFIMNKTWRLDCLAHVEHLPDYDGDLEHRSWAPRWDHQDDIFHIGDRGLKNCPWSVCPSLIATLTDDNDLGANVLVLRGICYDRVQQMTEILDLHTTNAEFTGGKNMEDTEGSQHVQARNRILARTVVSGMLDFEFVENLEESVQEEFYISFMHLLRELSSVHPYFSDSGCPYTADTKSVLYKARLQCSQRRVFWTNNGSLGLGPQCMRVGDIVVALYGGNTPYVLRPRGEKYLFLGEAYVDNIMHGELMQALAEGQVHEQTFHLI
ncbi:heterokaryon incompatibility protein-domain-containing protein [Paraphoma chrysanthemicola]|nr:heterokaryon incompatibility protein-domain-containing protein [Paraphoma chrysanthemicola]